MPAKKGGVVTPQHVRELLRDETSMRLRARARDLDRWGGVMADLTGEDIDIDGLLDAGWRID